MDLNIHEEIIAKGIHYIINTYDHDLEEWLPNHVNKSNVRYKTGSGWANPSAESEVPSQI